MSTIATSPDSRDAEKPTERRALNATTWVIQVLLALLFVFAGAMKFIVPMEEMTKNLPLPGAFLYAIGVAELLGGLGMVLPGALKIRRGLTPLAAVGLTLIMVGAVVITLRMDLKMAVMPAGVGLLTAFVAFQRWPWLVARA